MFQKKLQSIVFLLSVLSLHILNAQVEQDTLPDWDRTFMPALQIGYVHHGAAELTGGLMTQTSIEYRHKLDFVLRLNYDNLNSNMNIDYPIDPNMTYTGAVSFTDIIGGIGFRDVDGKHNFTCYVQGGVRSYGFPTFTENNGNVSINFSSYNIGVMRYTLGYEFALTPKVFLSIEALLSHVLESKAYWNENQWSYGLTTGLSIPLF